jgi:site-specific DNA-methyltransferase (adenine-specific)
MEVNQVVCCDCLEGMKTLPDECIDLSISSPPYDDLRSYRGYNFQFEPIAAELFRVTKTGGVVVWIVKDAVVDGSETGTSFRQALHFKEVGFRLHDTMIYMRNGVTFPDAIRYYNCFEYMFVFSKGKPKTFNPIKDHRNSSAGSTDKGKQRKRDGVLRQRWADRVNRIRPEWSSRWNVWTYPTGYQHTAPDKLWLDHPAIFPLKLAEDHIRSWTNPGDIVFDPMAGSGQTLIAAKTLGRDWLGFDCCPEYVDLMRRRLALYSSSS